MNNRTMYFSYNPTENEFETHETLEQAKEAIDFYLDQERDIARSEGWIDDIESYCYGELKGFVSKEYEKHEENYTEEEWESLTRGFDCDTVCDYEIKEIGEIKDGQ